MVWTLDILKRVSFRLPRKYHEIIREKGKPMLRPRDSWIRGLRGVERVEWIGMMEKRRWGDQTNKTSHTKYGFVLIDFRKLRFPKPVVGFVVNASGISIYCLN